MSRFKKYLGDAGILTIQAVVQRLLGLVTSALLARGLGPTGFGAYSAVLNTASTAYQLIKLGIDAAIHVHVAKAGSTPDARHKTGAILGVGLLIMAGCGGAAGIAVTMSADWISSTVFGDPSLGQVLRFAGFLTTLQCLAQFGYTVLAGFQKFRLYAWITVVNALIMTMFSLVGMWLGAVAGAVIGYCSAQVVFTVALLLFAIHELRLRKINLTVGNFKASMLEVMRLGIPFYLSGLLVVPVYYFLQGWLSQAMGIEELGYLRVIGTIVSLILFIPGSISSAAISALARERAESASSGQVTRYAIFQVKIVFAFGVAMAILIGALLPQLISPIFGPRYVASERPALIACLGAVFASTSVAASSLFLALERTKVLLVQSVIQAGGLLGVGMLLIPNFGLHGYVWAEVVANALALCYILQAMLGASALRAAVIRGRNAFAICGCLSAAGLLMTLTDAWIERYAIAALCLLLLAIAMLRWGLCDWEEEIVQRGYFAFRAKSSGNREA